MSDVIKNTETPMTVSTLASDFGKIGLKPGMTVLVHSSLSSIGWTVGGSVSVVQALMDIITEEGTIVMPTHSGDLSDPAKWENPPVPDSWWQTIRDTMPAFDPAYTPTNGMGAIVDVFRSFPKVERSNHPSVSFAAWGKYKERVVSNHSLDFGLGEQSPLAKLYDLDAKVLFIGTTYDTNTCFHLGEYRAGNRNVVTECAPVIDRGERTWKSYQEIEYDDEMFEKVGEKFESKHLVCIGKVGMANARLFSIVDAVDFSTEWFRDFKK
ncbi:AAC(3) family N-acetyltransferase [Bacillus shivajii]|uniref:aminoglycoside N(3)-acetyltransferase n=1 Tax=Bacillus shivajii TaxID=1983719 RepID=UPI001CF9F89D|nr:AAC(3) family N-acetyltransferase [Bacillus shivajii]UCZ53075.1 AAC(3) family N-acetyltransferase [Bacillus shivajii]